MNNNIIFETKNIKKMRKNILIIDTETARGLENPIPYDISVGIYNKLGKLLFAKTFLVSEIWNNDQLYNSSFYGASKRGEYNSQIRKGTAEILTAKQVMKEIKRLIKNNNVGLVGAYNYKFDNLACLNLSTEYNTTNPFYGMPYFDIQLLTAERLRGCKHFYDYIEKNNLKTQKGYASIKVDTVYKYLFKSKKVEEHRGLEDIKQESKIFFKFVNENPIVIINLCNCYDYFTKYLKM